MPKVLVLGATGGIGSKALLRLLERGVEVTVLVRSADRLPDAAKGHANLSIVTSVEGHLGVDLTDHVRGCDAVVSCLGHNLTRKGIWGKQGRWLCLDTTRAVLDTIGALRPSKPVKYIVVSTEGVDQPNGEDPKRGKMERFVLWLLKHLLPPHADNMATIAFLGNAPNSEFVDFCAVRPSDLIDGEESAYSLHATLQNGIFNAGQTTRANVGRFMADLVTEPSVWAKWKGCYPQLLNVAAGEKKDN